MKLNSWQWKPVVQAMARAGIIDDETADLLSFNADAPLTRLQAEQAANVIDALVTAMPDGSRLMLDGSIVDGPDDGTFHRRDLDLNYSTPRTTLQTLAAFCRSSGGFTVG